MLGPSLPPPRQSRRVRFEGGNGFELAGIVDSASLSDDVPHPIVVFSHCFTCNKDLKAIVRISRALATSGVSVLRYDMTGLGGSEGDFSWTNFSTNVNDLRAALRFASKEIGPVTGLIGHSFGGAASLAVGGDPQSAASSLRAIVTLAAPSDTQHLANLMDWMSPAIASAGVGEVEIGGRRWSIRKEMTADFRSHRLADLVTRIEVPLLILHSPEDETVGFDQALRIYQLASTRPIGTRPPPVSLVALDGADHLLAKDANDSAYVAEIVSAFFRRHQ
jgi:pimeloyl-ACP methyl ester carboxylesterase